MSGAGPWLPVSRALSWLFWLTLARIGVLVTSALIVASFVDSMTSPEAIESAMDSLTRILVAVYAIEVAVMVALAGYARVPEVSGARGSAIAAVVLAGLALGFDFLSTLPLFARDYAAMADSSPWDTLSSVGKLAFVFVQMSSFRSLANHLGQAEVARSAGLCMRLVGLILGVALVGLLLFAASGSELLGILLVVAVVGLAIWALVLHLLVIFKLARCTREQDDVASAFT